MPALDKKDNKPSSELLKPLSPEERVELLKSMVLIRRFEEKAAQAFMQAKIKGFCHLYIGQEAVAVGSISVLEPEDAVITAYRDHGHGLARGMCPKACMAELFGKAAGCSKGKGGSMHFFDAEKHFFGGHGIVGGQTPLGAGIAFAQKYLGKKNVTICYLGDGAINQGCFHEAKNLAGLWNLPVIYAIENNGYAMGTSIERSSSVNGPLYSRADAYGMAGLEIDGMDLDKVRAGTIEAVNLARTECEPSLVEYRTYRYRGHSMSDPGNYRSKEEIEEYKKEDPIEVFKNKLIAEKAIDEKDYQEIDDEIKARCQEAVDFAESADEPAVHEIYDDIFSPETQIPEIPRENRPEF